MTDLQKVIKALELCRYDPDPGMETKGKHSCEKCPYYNDGIAPECHKMYDDAIAMLRQKEPVQAIRTGGKTVWWYVCNECRTVFSANDLYCRHCGRPVRWIE